MAGWWPWKRSPKEVPAPKEVPDKYTNLGILGKGSFGTVYLCEDKKSKKRRAIKKIDLDVTASSASKSGLRKVKKEAGILKRIKHPNIVQFFDFICETKDVCFIVTEYCEDGDLRKVIRSAQQPGIQLLQSDVFKWSREILNAVAYLHSKNIIHRDIKPANILLQNNTIKIADFGLSRFYLPDEILTSYAGTVIYMAPEMRAGKGYTKSADIWSVGCVLYELYYLKKACEKGPTPPTAFPDRQEPSFNNAIKRMLQTNPESRPSATDAIEILEPSRPLYRYCDYQEYTHQGSRTEDPNRPKTMLPTNPKFSPLAPAREILEPSRSLDWFCDYQEYTHQDSLSQDPNCSKTVME